MTIQARTAARIGVVTRNTIVSRGLSTQAIASPMQSMTGLRTSGRRPALTALSMTVTSVVMRVTRDASEKRSRLAKSNFCTAAYSAMRSSAANPFANRAAYRAYSSPVMSASTAHKIISPPCRKMTAMLWVGTPSSTRVDIRTGMTISKIHSIKISPTAANRSRRYGRA